MSLFRVDFALPWSRPMTSSATATTRGRAEVRVNHRFLAWACFRNLNPIFVFQGICTVSTTPESK